MIVIHAHAVCLFSNLEARWHTKHETAQLVIRCLVLLSRIGLARHPVISWLNNPTTVESKTIQLLLILEIKLEYMIPFPSSWTKCLRWKRNGEAVSLCEFATCFISDNTRRMWKKFGICNTGVFRQNVGGRNTFLTVSGKVKILFYINLKSKCLVFPRNGLSYQELTHDYS
jgi:hypothetical protein